MTLCRQKRLTTSQHSATYEQRRRCLQRQGSSSFGRGGRWFVPPSHEDNKTKDSTTRSYLVGAFIYKKPPVATSMNSASPSERSESELALHVFDQYQIKVRNTEPESRVLKQIAQEYSAVVKGKPTFTSSVYMVQKYMPVRYSSQCLIELNRKAYWSPTVRYKVNLEFKRTYVSSFQHEYHPSGRERATYLSTICINVPGGD